MRTASRSAILLLDTALTAHANIKPMWLEMAGIQYSDQAFFVYIFAQSSAPSSVVWNGEFVSGTSNARLLICEWRGPVGYNFHPDNYGRPAYCVQSRSWNDHRVRLRQLPASTRRDCPRTRCAPTRPTRQQQQHPLPSALFIRTCPSCIDRHHTNEPGRESRRRRPL